LKLNLKNTVVYTVLGFLPLSFSLLFTPLYTQYLSRADYGLLNLFNVISGMLIPFYGLGIDQAAGFLYWDYSRGKTGLARFMSTTLLLVTFVAVFFLIAGTAAGPWIVRTFVKDGEHFTLWPFLLLALVYPFFMTANRVLLYYYRNENNLRKYALLNVSSLVLITAGSVLGVITFTMGAEGAVEGRTIGFCVIILAFLFYEAGKLGLSYDRGIASTLLRMGGPLFVSTVIGSVAYVGDRLIVEQMGTLDMLGIYGFSVTIASVIEILMGALGNAFTPGIYKIMHEEKEEEYDTARFQLFVYVFTVTAAVALATAVITPFMKLFIADTFFEATRYIPLLCVAFVPRLFTQLYSLKFYKRKKTSFILWLNLAYLASMMGSGIWLYAEFGLTGTALAVLFTGLVNMCVAAWLSGVIDAFPFRFGKLLALFFCVAAAVCALPFLPHGGREQYYYYLLPLAAFAAAALLFLRKECTLVLAHLSQSMRRYSQREKK
jgi:O-antigen/teichoic acid export membrane protein